MNHSGAYTFVPAMGIGSHTVHPWVQAQRIQQPEEQYLPSTIPSYMSQIHLPSTSYTQYRVINYNSESVACEQRTGVGIINTNCQFTIPIELLSEQSISLPELGLKEIIFLGPHPAAVQHFQHSKEFFVMKAMRLLQNVRSLKKVTFSLDFTHLEQIFGILATIPGMEEIVLTLPTAANLEPDSRAMQDIQNAIIEGLGIFRGLKRLKIPMEIVTTLLLSFLAGMPCLESLTISYSPPPRSPHHPPFPAWSSYRDPADCPGRIFLNHLLRFDPREHFRQLSYLDLGAPLSDASYTTLKSLFPRAHIC